MVPLGTTVDHYRAVDVNFLQHAVEREPISFRFGNMFVGVTEWANAFLLQALRFFVGE